MADSYTLRAGDVSRTEAKVVREAALNDLAGLGRGELREALKAVADTLATSDGTVHIRCYYREEPAAGR